MYVCVCASFHAQIPWGYFLALLLSTKWRNALENKKKQRKLVKHNKAKCEIKILSHTHAHTLTNALTSVCVCKLSVLTQLESNWYLLGSIFVRHSHIFYTSRVITFPLRASVANVFEMENLKFFKRWHSIICIWYKYVDLAFLSLPSFFYIFLVFILTFFLTKATRLEMFYGESLWFESRPSGKLSFSWWCCFFFVLVKFFFLATENNLSNFKEYCQVYSPLPDKNADPFWLRRFECLRL